MTEADRLEHQRRRRRALAFIALGTIAATAVSWALSDIKLPYLIFAPGAAVDLNGVISIARHSPPPGSLFLTDVDVLQGRPIYYAAAKILPGFEIVRRDEVAPPSMTDQQLDSALVDDMKQSQQTAEIVAERAAGLHVPSHPAVVVADVARTSPAASCLRVSDKIVAIDGKPVTALDSFTGATRTKPVGSHFALSVIRGNERVRAECRTALFHGKPRFGVKVSFDPGAYSVPIPVRFDVHDINGSSAGLMFALQIYRTLTGRDLGPAKMIAGTGVLQMDGSVDPIEGTREKVEAAKRAGATVFLVPEQNYAEVRGTRGIAILPVRSFDDALRSLRALKQ